MFKNEKKFNVEQRKMTVSEKVINLSDLLKPNSLKNNLQNNLEITQKPTRTPFIRQVAKTDK